MNCEICEKKLTKETAWFCLGCKALLCDKCTEFHLAALRDEPTKPQLRRLQ